MAPVRRHRGWGPRRTVLDRILVAAAVEAGAKLTEGFSVPESLRSPAGITHIGVASRWREQSYIRETAVCSSAYRRILG